MRNYRRIHDCIFIIIMEASEPIVGIDLGTTNSCIAIKRNGKIDVIPNREGKRTTLSFVHYATSGEVLVGKIAKHQSASNPANGIYEIKRIIGCQHDELDIEKEKQWLTYGFIRGVNGETHIELEDSGGEKYYKLPEEVCGRILHKLKLDAEAYLGRKLSKAVITVPAYFNNNQRAATRDAARIAGFDPIKLINEPSAAAVAYIESSSQAGQSPPPPRTILIYDLGGGTFDVSIVKTGEQASAASGVRVLSVSGDVRLGGRDFVCHLADYLTSEIETRCNTIISDNQRNVRNVMDHCERIKKILTASSSTCIVLPEFTTSEGKQVEMEITRSKFEELNRDLFERTIEIVDACIRQRRLCKEDIDEVLLVGGSSRMPKVEQLLKAYFGERDLQIKRDINADEAIAIGAAIEADFLSKSLTMAKTEVADEGVSILTDVLPLGIGTVLDEGTIFFNFAKNTPLPASSTHVHRVDRKRKQKSEHILSFYEGDHVDYHKNVLLGAHEVKFPSQCAKKEIKVTMKVSTNGIIRIMASGETIKKFNIVLNKGRLEEDEIGKIRSEVQKVDDC